MKFLFTLQHHKTEHSTTLFKLINFYQIIWVHSFTGRNSPSKMITHLERSFTGHRGCYGLNGTFCSYCGSLLSAMFGDVSVIKVQFSLVDQISYLLLPPFNRILHHEDSYRYWHLKYWPSYPQSCEEYIYLCT